MSTNVIAPEIAEFMTAVRSHLADLDPEEQREISDGLVADLTELVADQGLDALGDPGEYARELRTAAGLAPSAPVARRSASVRVSVEHVLDTARDRARAQLDRLPADVRAAVLWLRPVWWLLRAVVAVVLLHVVTGWGWLPLAVAVPLSVLIGSGKLWPGRTHGVSSRVVLVALNTFAVLIAPIALANAGSLGDDHGASSYDRGYAQGYGQAQENAGPVDQKGIYVDGEWISNIYPYDAQGKPLVGVQLYNQVGEPINVVTQPEYEALEYNENGDPMDQNGNLLDPNTAQFPRVYYPWSNGATQLFNVYPLPSRQQESEERSPDAFTDKVKPKVGAFPKPSVPAISLPGILTGMLPGAR